MSNIIIIYERQINGGLVFLFIDPGFGIFMNKKLKQLIAFFEMINACLLYTSRCV